MTLRVREEITLKVCVREGVRPHSTPVEVEEEKGCVKPFRWQERPIYISQCRYRLCLCPTAQRIWGKKQ
jgi:hypothetical protein